MEKVTVSVNPGIADQVPGFLENRRNDTAKIPEFLEDGDFEAIRARGQSMMNVASSYGFKAIARMGESLMGAADDRDPQRIRELVQELSAHLDCIEVVYR